MITINNNNGIRIYLTDFFVEINEAIQLLVLIRIYIYIPRSFS